MLHLLWNQIKHFLRHQPIVFLLETLSLVGALVAMSLFFEMWITLKQDERIHEESFQEDTCYYKTYVAGDDAVFRRVFGEEYADNRRRVVEEFEKSDVFEFQNTMEATVFFETQKEDTEKEWVELAGYYMAREADWSHLLLAQGEAFCDSDFVLSEDYTIPIVLGSDYAEEYNIGDCIEAECVMVEKPVCLVVKGILKQNSFLYDNNLLEQQVDNAILLPNVELAEPQKASIEELNYIYNTQKLMNARISVPVKEKEKMLEEAYRIFQKNGLYEMRLFPESEGNVSYIKDQRGWTMVYCFTASLLSVLCIGMYCFHLFYQLHTEKKTYGILCLHGLTRMPLHGLVLGNTLVVFAAADVLYIVLYFLVMKGILPLDLGLCLQQSMLLTFLIEAILLAFVCVVSHWMMRRMNVGSVLREI